MLGLLDQQNSLPRPALVALIAQTEKFLNRINLSLYTTLI